MLSTFGLFETAADVCSTISGLAKTGFDPASLCLLARDVGADTGEQSDRRVTVAQVVNALDLIPAVGLLGPMALVLIPEEGTFLAAGWPARELTSFSIDRTLNQNHLRAFLVEFGCSREEASFLDGRLQAGMLLLGIADPAEERLKLAREIFADQQAIHVGAADLPDAVMQGWCSSDIPRPGAVTRGDGVVLDISALNVIGEGNSMTEHELIGRTLIDEAGAEIGPISSVVIDPQSTGTRDPLYIVAQHGGFLGVGRHEYVIPIELVNSDSASGSFRARLNLEVLENAPAFNPAFPISRKEEQSICGYYGLIPYWDSGTDEWLIDDPSNALDRRPFPGTSDDEVKTG